MRAPLERGESPVGWTKEQISRRQSRLLRSPQRSSSEKLCFALARMDSTREPRCSLSLPRICDTTVLEDAGPARQAKELSQHTPRKAI
jgi:hypothetical protein